jgi:hypothetical protein
MHSTFGRRLHVSVRGREAEERLGKKEAPATIFEAAFFVSAIIAQVAMGLWGYGEARPRKPGAGGGNRELRIKN